MRNILPYEFYSVLFAGFMVLFISGCGPTRKEYAINEALLVDQTRMLEDQLYRSHFQIQHLLDENARLKARLGESDEQDPNEAPVPFENDSANEKQKAQRPYYPPINPSEMPENLPPAAEGELPMTISPYQTRSPQRVAQRTAGTSYRQMNSGKQNYRLGGSQR